MKHQEEIIWNYLDGQAGPEERLWVEKQLAEEKDFREEFLQCQLLHKNLQSLEVEEPSLRFSQNVMDKLPVVRDLAVNPLISTKWLKTFYIGVIGFLLFLVGGNWALSSKMSGPDQEVNSLIDTFHTAFNYIPAGALFMGGIIIISLLLLLLLDRWLQAKFVKS